MNFDKSKTYKLIDMNTYPNKQEFLEMIEDELTEKSNEETSKMFTTVLNKYQKEKDKFLTFSNNLQNLADHLFIELLHLL